MELTFGNFLASNNVSVNKTDAQFTISSGAVSRTAPDFFSPTNLAGPTTALIYGTAIPMVRVICRAAVRNSPESEAKDALPPE